MSRAALFTGWIALVLVSCVSRSPFTRSPAEVAMGNPCRFMGTFHKESRQRIEELRACHAISMDQWYSMARALQALDKEFTARCKVDSVSLSRIEKRQRELYTAGSEPPQNDTIECALLSTDGSCMAEVCGGG